MKPGLTKSKLISAIRERRRIIRYHRDQKMDDRCWLDDYLVWSILPDSPAEPSTPPPFAEAMAKCRKFYKYRRAEKADHVPKDAILNRRLWDKDLLKMTKTELLRELGKIEQAIRKHRDILRRPYTINDDRRLYKVLPEKIPADFRLPKKLEFLGEAEAPRAGCPSFWRSHETCAQNCKSCDLHKWGPCCRRAEK